MKSLEKIIAEKTRRDENTGCLLWTGSVSSSGYAQIGRGGIPISVHRYVCERTYGKLDKGMLAIHSCDNKHCVEPSHIKPGTRAQNTLDTYDRGLMSRLPHISDKTRENWRKATKKYRAKGIIWEEWQRSLDNAG